jgi:hypothetical protein
MSGNFRIKTEKLTIDPDIGITGNGLLKLPPPWYLEHATTLEGSNAFELGSPSVEPTGIKRRSLCDVRRVELREVVQFYIGYTREEFTLDPFFHFRIRPGEIRQNYCCDSKKKDLRDIQSRKGEKLSLVVRVPCHTVRSYIRPQQKSYQ